MRKVTSVILVGLMVLPVLVGIVGSSSNNVVGKVLGNLTDTEKDDAASQAGQLMGGVFTRNLGQLNNSDVRYYLSSSTGGIAFCKGYVMMTVQEPQKSRDFKGMHVPGEYRNNTGVRKGRAIKLTFVGSNAVEPVGMDPVSWHNNYFIGSEPEKWVTNVPNYRKVVYKDLWDGIDLVYYTTDEGRLKYDYIVKPYADPDDIKVRVEGHEGLELTDGGRAMVINTELGPGTEIMDSGLDVFYQDNHAEKITANFTLDGDTYTFHVVGWDKSRAMVIDPLVYSTYLGGSEHDYSLDISVDFSGCAYVTGHTRSIDFPTTEGAYNIYYNGGYYDAYVTKLSPDGSSLVYSTYLGGSSSEGWYYYSISVDSSGCAYVTGSTRSTDFPTTEGAYDTSYNGGGLYGGDAFVTKLSSDGSSLVYSTYLGGSLYDEGNDITVDSSGCAYVTGSTRSTDFPTTEGAYDTSYNGGNWDTFVTKLSSDGSSLVYSTYLGGSNDDEAYGISVDSSNCAYVTGGTHSTDFPTTEGDYNTSYNGGNWDTFVTKLSSDGSSLGYSTYIGGSNDDEGTSISVDSSNCAYVIGDTGSTDFPTTGGAYDISYNGGSLDAFVTKLSSDGSSLMYSTYLGGSDYDYGWGIAVDSSGCMYVVGDTKSTDLSTTNDAYDTSLDGVWDAFVTKLSSDGSSLVYSTYLGGSDNDYGQGMAMDSSGYVYVTGDTYSTDFPTTSGAYDTSHNGKNDAFITKLSLRTVQTVPSAPQNLQATAGDGQITLTWDPPADDGGSSITGYKIYRGTSSGGEAYIAGVSGYNTNYTDTNVTNGQTYYYQVSAANAAGEGPKSNEVSAKPESSATVPSAPRNLQATAGEGYVTLTWDQPADDGGSPITGYKIYRGTSSGGETYIAGVSGSTTTYIDKGVTNGQTYYYQVSAVNSVGEGPKSNEVSAKPESSVTVPSAPQVLHATAGDDQVSLSWDPPVDDGGSTITNYKVYRSTSSGSETLLTTVGNMLTYTDSSVNNGVTYYYQVSAVNSAGEGPNSSEVSATPTSSVMEPSALQNLTATPGDGKVTLSWGPPADDGGSSITEYKIYRGTSIGAEACYASVDNSTTNYVDGGAVRGLTYYYQVSAVNTAGEGPRSNAVSATPFGKPTAPQSLRAMTGDGKITLSWYPPDDDGGLAITKYKIYRGTSSGGETYYDSVDGSTTTYTDTNVTSGVTYYYRVSGVNSAVEGARSNEVSAAPTSPSSEVSTGVDQSSGGENLYLLMGITIIVVGFVVIYILGSKKR